MPCAAPGHRDLPCCCKSHFHGGLQQTGGTSSALGAREGHQPSQHSIPFAKAAQKLPHGGYGRTFPDTHLLQCRACRFSRARLLWALTNAGWTASFLHPLLFPARAVVSFLRRPCKEGISHPHSQDYPLYLHGVTEQHCPGACCPQQVQPALRLCLVNPPRNFAFCLEDR